MCSTYLTYLLECVCRLQYVGRTIRKLRIRLREPIANIKKGLPYNSLSEHFRKYHNKDLSYLKVCAIDKKEKHWKDTNMKQAVSQNEKQWIYQLGTMVPTGLNVELNINCFIHNCLFTFFRGLLSHMCKCIVHVCKLMHHKIITCPYRIGAKFSVHMYGK